MRQERKYSDKAGWGRDFTFRMLRGHEESVSCVQYAEWIGLWVPHPSVLRVRVLTCTDGEEAQSAEAILRAA